MADSISSGSLQRSQTQPQQATGTTASQATPASVPTSKAATSPTTTSPPTAPTATPAAEAPAPARTTSAPAAAPAPDAYAASSSASGRASTAGGSLEAGGNGNGNGSSGSNIAMAAAAAGEVANLTRSSQGASDGGSVTVHVESLGSPSAMTKDLLDALAAGRGQQNPTEALANATALVAMAQKAVDNIPHRLVDTNDDLGTKLYQAPADRAQGQRAAELVFLRMASTRVQASEALGKGPEWPAMMLEGLSRASASWAAPQGSLGAEADALTRANMALYGRELTTLGPKHAPEEIFKAASLANAPLGLPASAVLDINGEARGFVVLQTQQSATGEQSLLLLDVGQSVAEGSEVHREMQAEKFVQALSVLMVPNGKPAISTERQQEDALHTLGLIGCCLTSGGGNLRATGTPMRASGARGGRGLLENRCLTCAQAQQMCQPSYVAPKPPAPAARGPLSAASAKRR